MDSAATPVPVIGHVPCSIDLPGTARDSVASREPSDQERLVEAAAAAIRASSCSTGKLRETYGKRPRGP